MNRITSSFLNRSMALALVATVLVTSTLMSAKTRKPKILNTRPHVVAHIPLPGLTPVDMAMQAQGNDKFYLYVQHSNDQGISIIDVTKPNQPKALGLVPWPNPDQTGRMSVTGNLAVIAESGIPVMHASDSNDGLVFWDLCNPAVPTVVDKFSGVVKWFQDERNFVYVLNGDGLWIVSEPAERQPSDEPDSSNSYGG
jgi:hypothetical protein